MNEFDETAEHPDDETLTAFALGEIADTDIETHIAACPACSRQLQELRVVHNAMMELDDEEPGEELRRKIVRAVFLHRWPGIRLFSSSAAYLMKNPYICILSIILLVIFLYIFFVFVI